MLLDGQDPAGERLVSAPGRHPRGAPALLRPPLPHRGGGQLVLRPAQPAQRRPLGPAHPRRLRLRRQGFRPLHPPPDAAQEPAPRHPRCPAAAAEGEAQPLLPRPAAGAGGRAVAALRRSPAAAGLGRQAGGCPVPVPALVPTGPRVARIYGRPAGASAPVPPGGGVPPGPLAGRGARPPAHPALLARARPAPGLRGRAPGLLLQRAAPGRGHGAPGRGPLPRAQRRHLGGQGADHRRALQLPLHPRGAGGVGAPRAPAGPGGGGGARALQQLLPRLRGAQRSPDGPGPGAGAGGTAAPALTLAPIGRPG